MEDLLATIGSQAMKYAIRSGIALTSRYALGQCSLLLTVVDQEDVAGHEKRELASLQKLLESKIKVIAPTIDLVEFKSGRGNVFLDSALPLTKSLHRDIVSLGQRIEKTVANIEHTDATIAEEKRQLSKIVVDIKELLGRIDREIPLLQLAITASGESLSSSLPPGISPSRLLQASTLLTFGDSQFAQKSDEVVQIGPVFCLSLYMLFVGHAPRSHKVNLDRSATSDSKGKTSYGIEEGDRKPIWQEVVHKARVKLCRAPCRQPASEDVADPEFAYHLDIVQDEDDGRVHETTVDPSLGGRFWSRKQRDQAQEDSSALQERIPIHQVSKIFYTDSGRLLNIGDDSQDGKKPVLLLKRDIKSKSAATNVDELLEYIGEDRASGHQAGTEEDDTQAELDRQLLGEQPEISTPHVRVDSRSYGFPKDLDPEWIAMEMYEEAEDESDSSSEASDSLKKRTQGEIAQPNAQPQWPRYGKTRSQTTELESRIGDLSLRPKIEDISGAASRETSPMPTAVARSPFGGITTSLSLIEMLVRLASLQEFQQASHLTIPDHILTFFLEETSTTGLVGDAQWRAREEAKSRVGFDPYSDNPAGGK